MNRDNDEEISKGKGASPSTVADAKHPNQRHEPRFDSFNDDEYEEPERDTDSASGFRSPSDLDDADFEDSFSDQDDNESDLFSDEEYDDEPESELSDEDQPEDWLDEDEDINEEVRQGASLPFGLIAVAIVALVLLVAGGYGVMQEREATQDELRQLRATLATTSNTSDSGAGREAMALMKQSYDKLAAEAEALTLENRRLTDTIAGLQAQLGAQQDILAKSPSEQDGQAESEAPKSQAKAPAAKPAPVQKAASPQPPAPAPTKPQAPAPKATAPAAAGDWFVNFGSYTSRAVAESWSTKLHPIAGKVIVVPSIKDGTTYYRVRVIGLSSKSTAQEVARKLEGELQVKRLWVGQE